MTEHEGFIEAIADRDERIKNMAEIYDALTAERDAYAKAADDMAAAHKVERDALKDAARLALDALENLHGIDTETEAVTIWVDEEIAALKAVL